MLRNTPFAIALLGLAPLCAFSEVADSSAAGFTVKIAVHIQAPPAQVYRSLFRIENWWSPAHTFSGNSQNLSLEEKAPGCFCEKLPGGGSVRHMEVVNVMPGTLLVLSGGLGPLQSMAATGSMTYKLSPDGTGTSLALVYAVSGYSPAGMNALAGPVDAVLSEQMTRLKDYIEKGKPGPNR
jgi:uncharacterized protein YndB with AHSA1/START domain